MSIDIKAQGILTIEEFDKLIKGLKTMPEFDFYIFAHVELKQSKDAH